MGPRKHRALGLDMNPRLALFLSLLVVCGCGQRPFPAGRLVQPAGKFSFVTPDSWFRSKPPGIEFTVVSAPADSGMQPNIFVNGIVSATNLDNAATQLVEWYKSSLPSYKESGRAPLATASGIPALKISARKQTGESLEIAMFHYFFLDGVRVIQITCSCPGAVGARYEPVFDAAMKSLETAANGPH